MIPLLLTVLLACTDGHGTATKGCVEAAWFTDPQWCTWTLEPLVEQGLTFWDNGWQAWTIRCVEEDA